MNAIKNLQEEIDKAVSSNIVKLSTINYQNIINNTPRGCNNFTAMWTSKYNIMTQVSNEIVEFSDNHYQCLFDCNYERVVCFFGKTQPTTEKREQKRQSGFIPKFTQYYKNKDRGHFLSHCQGGGMDVNFFPQNKEINRGWSAAGKIYRKMEKFCSKTAGIFCFSRPLYDFENTSWVPEQIEYGIVTNNTCIAVIFPN